MPESCARGIDHSFEGLGTGITTLSGRVAVSVHCPWRASIFLTMRRLNGSRTSGQRTPGQGVPSSLSFTLPRPTQATDHRPNDGAIREIG